MTMPTDARLHELGDALERAAARDLAAAAHPGRPPRVRRRRIVAVAAAVLLIPGGALAASQLLTEEDVAAGLPRGTQFLVGTDPTCTTVRDQVEYECTTAKAPVGEIAAGRFEGTVEPTVGADHRVNGGCRATDADGTRWRCYLGREAVRQEIIGAGFLGERTQGPGRG